MRYSANYDHLHLFISSGECEIFCYIFSYLPDVKKVSLTQESNTQNISMQSMFVSASPALVRDSNNSRISTVDATRELFTLVCELN